MTASRNVFFALCVTVASVFAVAASAGPNPGGKKPVPTYKIALKPVPPAKPLKASAQKSASKTKTARNPGINCVQYVRSVSDVELSGDGWMWWDRAGDRYERGNTPQPGAIMVFKRTKSMVHGHVAIVSELVDERTIRINHANWAPRGGLRGRVDTDVTVQDISDNNDWSAVRVWYEKADNFGRPYPIAGFVYSPSGGVPAQDRTIEAKTTPVKLERNAPLQPSYPPYYHEQRRPDEAASLNDSLSTQLAQRIDWAADRRSN
ncbi:MAG: CHAP domain-containing protein [Alphaproteobacteria bacterium]